MAAGGSRFRPDSLAQAGNQRNANLKQLIALADKAIVMRKPPAEEQYLAVIEYCTLAS